MRLRDCLVGLLLLSPVGCSWAPYAVQNLVGMPLNLAEDWCFCLQAHTLARQAWKATCAQNPQPKRSRAYADGFHDGFVRYLQRNGLGEPPAVPPRCYRHPVLRTPQQQQAIEDWYAGYRRGAEVAREQGWREGIVVPIDLPPRNPYLGYRQEFVPYPPAPEETPAESLPEPKGPSEQLPQPRPLAKAADIPQGQARLTWEDEPQAQTSPEQLK